MEARYGRRARKVTTVPLAQGMMHCGSSVELRRSVGGELQPACAACNAIGEYRDRVYRWSELAHRDGQAVHSPRKPFRKPAGKLTARQARFANEFIKDLNIAAAARRVGISARYGIELLSKPHVLARIEELQAERNRRVQVDADWVLRRLGRGARGRCADLYDEDGTLKPANDWPEVWRAGWSRTSRPPSSTAKDHTGKPVVIGRMKDVTFADRVKRIELLGRHIAVQAFKERVQIGVGCAPSRPVRADPGPIDPPSRPKCGPSSTIPSPKRRAMRDAHPHTAHGMQHIARSW